MQIEAGTNPFTLFDSWYKEAVEAEINDPDAIALASVNADGMPSVRMVLLRQWSDEGFFFFTNYESRKAGELLATGKAAFCLHWKSLRRQIRVTGEVSKASPERSDDYFASRGRGSRSGPGRHAGLQRVVFLLHAGRAAPDHGCHRCAILGGHHLDLCANSHSRRCELVRSWCVAGE